MKENKQLSYASLIANELGLSIPKPYSYDVLSSFIAEHKQEFYRVQTEKTREAIVENVKITDFAQEIGFTLVKKGKYFSLKEHDSVIIDPVYNRYWRNSVKGLNGIAQGGSVIDFAHNFTGMSIADIMKEFSNRVRGELELTRFKPKAEIKKEKQPLVLPEAAQNYRNVYSYLIKTRHIEANIVNDFVKRKMLYMDKNNNCVFVSRDKNDNPVFACKRGTNTYKKFVGDVLNSDYSKGFYINNNSNKLFITESVIDSMSIMEIHQKNGEKYHEYDYSSLNGATKFECVINQLKENSKIEEVYLALDNDAAGRENSNLLRQMLTDEFGERLIIEDCFPEKTKDWNEELCYFDNNSLSFKEILPITRPKKLENSTTLKEKKEPNFVRKRKPNMGIELEMEMC